MSGIEDFFVHTVIVETYEGSGAFGDVYAAPATVPCFSDGKLKLVRDKTGNQVVSSTTLFLSVADGAKFTPDSRVEVAGRKAFVIAQNINDAPGLDLPVHAEIHLT